MRLIRIIVAVLCVASLGVSAEKETALRFATGGARGEIAGPVLGYVSSGNGRVRELRGIPGAAILGPHVQAADPQSRIVMSPSRPCFLAVQSERAGIVCGGEKVRELLAPGLEPSAPAAFSPSGKDAVFFHAAASVLRMVKDLERPAPEPLSWGAPIPEDSRLAIADEAAAVIAWTPASAHVFRQGGSQPLPLSESLSHVVFAPHAKWAMAASADGRLLRIDLSGDAPTVADWGVTAQAPVTGLAFARDGATAWIATSREVTRLDLATRAAQSFECACTIEDLAPLEGNAVFRMTALGKGPLYILDGDREEPQVVFVPGDAPPLNREAGRTERRTAR